MMLILSPASTRRLLGRKESTIICFIGTVPTNVKSGQQKEYSLQIFPPTCMPIGMHFKCIQSGNFLFKLFRKQQSLAFDYTFFLYVCTDVKECRNTPPSCINLLSRNIMQQYASKSHTTPIGLF